MNKLEKIIEDEGFNDTQGSFVKESYEMLDNKVEDNVNHPSHYTSHPSGIECIQVAEHYNYCVGNAIKYLWRAGLKKDTNKDIKAKRIEDLRKAIWYINREIERIQQ